MNIVFASSNENKIAEITAMLPTNLNVLSLQDIGCNIEIPETGATIEENAVLKAKYVVDFYSENCFADDSGLIVPELGGEPGVFSARYAGVHKNEEDNIDKLLANLTSSHDRKAHFQTTIALIIDERIEVFTGICEGRIALERMGTNGFGYDPVFVPNGFDRAFAEMSSAEKNANSHRKKAIEKFLAHLENQTIENQ